MKAVSVAVAAAGIIGAVHADDWANWNTWSETTTPVVETSTTPVVETTTPVMTTTPVVETSTTPVVETSTTPVVQTSTTPVVETSTTPVIETSTTPVVETSTTPVVETSTTTTTTTSSSGQTTPSWAVWTSSTTSSKPVESTSTTVSSVGSTTWAYWTSSSTPVVSTKTTTKPDENTSTTWAQWTSSKPVVPSSSTWSEWEVVGSTTTIKTTVTLTKTVYPSSSTPVENTPVPTTTTASWVAPPASDCVISIITSYGQPLWKPTPDTSMSTPVSSQPAVVTSTWAQWSSAVSTPVASSSAAPKPSGYPSGGSSSGGAQISPNGNQWGMTYSLYTSTGGCKSKDVVYSDVASMQAKGFTSIRVYSTDCYTLEYVGGAARQYGMKIILGVFINKEGISAAGGQVTDIVAWAQWDLVELIVVGNEVLFNKWAGVDELVGFISSCKSSFAAAGYTGAVTTTEELGIWQSSGAALCNVIDVAAANLYAFFNPNTAASDAGSFIASQVEIMKGVCSGKDVYVMESGWPSAGSCNGQACPGKQEQATAIQSIQSAVGSKIIWFSFEDEAWKTPGDLDVEQHWGCGDVFPDKWAKW